MSSDGQCILCTGSCSSEMARYAKQQPYRPSIVVSINASFHSASSPIGRVIPKSTKKKQKYFLLTPTKRD